MGQRPHAKIFYGFAYQREELPDDVTKEIDDDSESFLFRAMGILHLPYTEQVKLQGTFGAFRLHRGGFVLTGWSVTRYGWGIERFEFPSTEELAAILPRLREIAEKAGLSIKEPSWYIEADFG